MPRLSTTYPNEKKMIFWMPEDLHARVKLEAAKRRITIKDLMIQAVEMVLAAEPSDAKPAEKPA